MMGRLFWLMTLAAIGALALFAQLDRAARFDADLAAYSAPGLRGFAAEQLTRTALQEDNQAQALLHARELLKARPATAEAVMLLAQVHSTNGNNEAAIAAAEEAGKRGWRNGPAQLLHAQAALAKQDFDAASNRLAALLAIGAQGPEIDLLTRLTLSQEAGRDALAERFSQEGYWQRHFLRFAYANSDAEHFADFVARSHANNADFECPQIEQIVAALNRQDQPLLAQQIWADSCAN